ncbi:MAG: UDP-N-acetylmuramate--L-alanine ligase [Candidatus Omnitrophota bacterium]
MRGNIQKIPMTANQLSVNNYKLRGPIHFIGIGGCSMSGIAYILFKKGYKVQGADLQENSYTKRLTELGIKVYIGHKKDNIKDAKEIVYSNAVSCGNEELVLAKQKGLEIFPRGQILASLMNSSAGIAICGSHGKTTTSSLISFLFLRAGLEPTFIVGGNVIDLDTNAHVGKSELFIAEADESDGSFLMLSPLFEIITNIEEEHLDYYKNFENLKNAFLKYIHNIKNGGSLIAGGDDEIVKNILMSHKKNIKAQIITYGICPTNLIYASNIHTDNGKTCFEVNFKGKNLGKIKMSLLGIHNVKNALACIAVGLLNGIKFKEIAEILPGFRGVSRRFQIKGRYKGALIVDDYAHHPTEIKAAIQMVEELKPKRTIAIFQPHRYTRTQYFVREFAKALKKVDVPILIPIYAASEKPIPGVTSRLICEHLEKLGTPALHFENKKEVVAYLKKTIQPNDIVLTVGAGDVYKIGEELLGEN